MTRITGLLAASALAWVVLTSGRPQAVPEALVTNRPVQQTADGYVSSGACRACHADQHASWAGSFHRTMTQVATPATAAADFAGTTVADVHGAPMTLATRENVGKNMAVILTEKGKPEILSWPTIQSELGVNFQITGIPTSQEAKTLALLMRAGALAAPMEIIEERTIGPSLGADNIEKGKNSLLFGFALITVFMIVYYSLFGVISVISLAANLFFLIALLSMLQATLTLPGIAAIALTLGMAIDANVLINERIREELRSGMSPQMAIQAGYDRALDTIIDSNITTLIAGLALLIWGSGPVRGFAVVHCLGIITSIFSAVMVSRGIVNIIYGGKKKVAMLRIGNVHWARPVKPARV